ncbi:MAG: FAD-dependent oxidoreductase, partial [Chloroflexota bacterium]
RQLLADPDFPRKSLEGRDADVNRCILCQLCQGVTVAPGRTLHCTINASLGREIDPPPPKASQPKRVLVVGAGPAGMEAAIGLADRGCKVTLIERSNQVGGLLPWLARLPNLRLLDLAYLTERQAKLLATSNVTVRLSIELTEDLVEELAPDAIVLATGSQPPETPWLGGPQGADQSLASPWQQDARPTTGDGGRRAQAAGVGLCSVLDYLAGRQIGHRVVVDGRGEGAEIAVSLARGGHQVALVEASASLQPTIYDYALKRSQALADFLVESGVTTHWSSKVAAIEHGAVLIQRHNGLQTRLEADALLLTGRRPARPFADVLRHHEVRLIGDCHRPRGLAEALDEARAVVNTLCG